MTISTKSISKIYLTSIMQSGFTLLELLVVMAIISGLAVIFMTTYPASVRKARDAERRSDLQQYQIAIEAYANNHNGQYIAVTGELPTVCTNSLSSYTSTCPNDPKNSPNYEYRGNLTQYVLWATLEQKASGNATLFYVVCSNGLSGDTTNGPTTVTCTLN